MLTVYVFWRGGVGGVGSVSERIAFGDVPIL